MIQKFRRWLRNWLSNIEENKTSISGRGSGLVRQDDVGLEGNPMRLNVYRASGGMVIEARTYDSQRDRHHQTLHVITHDQNLAENLEKIITMESLRG
jgi:predicted ABC-type transport system involved in lysophospholipase L1 biosynthesis ATPase subunit